MFSGASVEELRRLSRDMSRSADRLNASVLEPVSRSMDGNFWLGHDSVRFHQEWQASLAPRLRSMADELDRLAVVIAVQADEQEHASSRGADASALASGAYPNANNTVAREWWRGGSYNGSPRQGPHGEQRDLIDLADAAYTPGDPTEVPRGWRTVTDAELRSMGLDPNSFHDKGSGFDATFFVSNEGRFVLAFRGTEKLDQDNNLLGLVLGTSDDPDVMTDHFGVDHDTAQDIRARMLAKQVKAALGEDSGGLIFTGHSLGGRLAAGASIATGVPSVTFNAAGMSPQALMAAESEGGGACTLDGGGLITAFHTDNDPLTLIQNHSGLPDSYGRDIYLHGTDSPWIWDFPKDQIDAHGLDEVRRGFEAKYAPGGGGGGGAW